jgi:hypothetical protein
VALKDSLTQAEAEDRRKTSEIQELKRKYELYYCSIDETNDIPVIARMMHYEEENRDLARKYQDEHSANQVLQNHIERLQDALKKLEYSRKQDFANIEQVIVLSLHTIGHQFC